MSLFGHSVALNVLASWRFYYSFLAMMGLYLAMVGTCIHIRRRHAARTRARQSPRVDPLWDRTLDG